MSAVIDFNAPLEAANLAAQRAKSYGYGGIATAQFVRQAATLASHGTAPWDAACKAVPKKDRRNGDSTGPEAA